MLIPKPDNDIIRTKQQQIDQYPSWTLLQKFCIKLSKLSPSIYKKDDTSILSQDRKVGLTSRNQSCKSSLYKIEGKYMINQ